MAISPINYAVVQRATDISAIKHQENVRPAVEQQNIQTHLQRKEEMQSRQVVETAQSEQTKNDVDAKDEGKGKYQSFGGKKKKETETPQGERVIKKQQTGRFDITI